MVRIWFVCAAAAALVSCGSEQATPTNSAAPVQSTESADFRPVGLIASDLTDIAAALEIGDITSEQLTEQYLKRIDAIDRAGPKLQAVLTVNPDALDQARASDARRAGGAILSPLDGVPILIKDNIETADPMPTTAGSMALAENQTERDAPVVAGLRAGGVVILGKTNLSEWANYRSNDSMSGWSGLGGQTKNPHVLDRNPCGSSSGSGAAVAASLAAAAVGTETNGSISCPSTINGVVGFKPSVGLVSQRYIVPISSTQDTAGPMTKTVRDAAMLLNLMADGAGKTDFVAALDENALAGKRIGVARYAVGSSPLIIELFARALNDLKAAGAELVEIEKFETDPEDLGDLEGKILDFEFKATINAYLKDAAPAVAARDLDSLIEFNKAHQDRELALFDQAIFEEAAKAGGLDDPGYKSALARALKAARENGIDKLLQDNKVVALVAPTGPLAPPVDVANGDVWPSWAGIGSLAAIAGYPHLTVPMGAARGLPVGISFIGGQGDDADILSLGYAYERKSGRRVEPRYLPAATADPAIQSAMAPLAR